MALNQLDEELMDAARTVINDNGDGEVHTVGAAVRDGRGQIHVGVNLYHFTGGPCAELVALAAARAAGADTLTAIVAVGDDGRGVLAPCGRDRQVLLDYYPAIRVMIPTEDGVEAVTASDLLPHSYHWKAEQVQRLRFRSSHFEAVRNGTKRLTMRFRDPVTVGPAMLVFEFDKEVTLAGRVLSTTAHRVDEVTDEQARQDGFANTSEVLPRLRGYYPDLQPSDELVLVTFDVDE